MGFEFWQTLPDGRIILHALPVMLAALLILAIAYRYYSAFLAAKLACLDDARVTPAHRLHDGQNYHPTNKWVLFGHHFAAISGAGPLIGPVLALQYGYAPGLLWLLVGVCLAGAVQDMLVLAASVRHDGKSLAELTRIARGPWAWRAVALAILVIIIIALAGLGFVVVKALGGEEVTFPRGTVIILPQGGSLLVDVPRSNQIRETYRVPGGCKVVLAKGSDPIHRSEPFLLGLPQTGKLPVQALDPATKSVVLPNGGVQVIPGSSWGVFTIACTIPIALFVGWYMYKIRPGAVVEASIGGGLAVLVATWAGSLIPGSALEPWFLLDKTQTILALCGYGFVASVLPVWMLLCPRDYLSSFLKIGTIGLLVVGTMIANPPLLHRPIEPVFAQGGPTFAGNMFPFVFICVMCGAISGFHALVASGTTPKMINRETSIRPIGYGAMLMEGLVGLVALIAGASIDPKLYYEINTDLNQLPKYQAQIDRLHEELGAARDLSHLDLPEVERRVEETLRGRTGGAVTLAVGMAQILTRPLERAGLSDQTISNYWKYWYHFAIMFEALFILTTIDTGTRIARFLVQELFGQIRPAWGRTDWLPGSLVASLAVTLGWGFLVSTGSIGTIWPMFGIANQMLAVLALAVVTTLLIEAGKGRYIWVTILPMIFVLATTTTAGVEMIGWRFPAMMRLDDRTKQVTGAICLFLTLFVMTSVLSLVLMAVTRWITLFRNRSVKNPRNIP